MVYTCVGLWSEATALSIHWVSLQYFIDTENIDIEQSSTANKSEEARVKNVRECVRLLDYVLSKLNPEHSQKKRRKQCDFL